MGKTKKTVPGSSMTPHPRWLRKYIAWEYLEVGNNPLHILQDKCRLQDYRYRVKYCNNRSVFQEGLKMDRSLLQKEQNSEVAST